MPLGTEVHLGPGHIVLNGNRAPPKRGTAAPSFWPMSMVKRSPISAIAEHLFYFSFFKVFQFLVPYLCSSMAV